MARRLSSTPSADRDLSRRELSSELFPDADDPLGSLRWCLASLRRAFGTADVLTGDPVRRDLGPDVRVDVLELRDGRHDPTATGELLEGIEPRCGPEFSTWLLVARQQVAAAITASLRDDVISAISRRQSERSVRLAEVLARRTTFDEGAHVLLVKALMLAGEHERALDHVVAVERTFRTELGCDPSPALRSAARPGMADPPPGVSTRTIAMTLLDSGRDALAAGATDAGVECLRRASAQAEASGDDALLARSFCELGTALVHSIRGFDDEGSVLLEQAAELAEQIGDGPTAVAALRERGYADALAGRRPQAQRHLDHAGEFVDGDDVLAAGVDAVAAFNLCDWGRHEEGLGRYEKAIEAARRCGDRRREAWALGLVGWTLHLAGDDGATGTLRSCLDIVHELRWTAFEPWPMAVLAEAQLAHLDDGELSSELERCFAMSCQLQDPCWEGASGRVMALHHARRNDHEEAVRWIVDARTRCERKSDIWSGLLGEIVLTEAVIRAAASDPIGSEAATRQTIALAAGAQLDDLLKRALDLLPSAG